MSILWRIELLGGLRVQRLPPPELADGTGNAPLILTRFRSRQAGALLAFLAYFPRRHARESLAEMLWPERDLQLSRAHLRVVLSSLRQSLEPYGEVSGSVLLADRSSVGLNFQAVTTDVAEFETALQEAAQTTGRAAQSVHLGRAVECYQGALLPDCFDEWILPEAQRLEDGFFAALRRLIAEAEQNGDLERALHLARRGAALSVLREDIARDLMRLLTAMGQPALALIQFKGLERSLKQALNTFPSLQTRQLLHQIEASGQSVPFTALPEVSAVEPLQLRSNSLPIVESNEASGQPEPFQPGEQTRLPPQWTRFFGREAEIAGVRDLLQSGTRLVTLTGIGGCGKTRLALAIARGLEADWEAENGRRALFFAPLADVLDAGLVAGSIAAAMRLPRAPISDLTGQIMQALRAHPQPILVLDNFEQLLPEGAALVQELMARVPPLRLLVTSRRELEIAGEQPFSVPALSVPSGLELSTDFSPDALLRFEGVALFHDRARTARPDFRLTRHNAPAVAKLCAALEGLPLAIELCAARAGAFSPSKMLVQLKRRLDFLAGPSPDSMSRHSTLRAALDWSYALLWPELQQFFQQLSVFRGGFTSSAAASIAAEPHAAHLLHQLRLASLLTSREIEGQTRFFLLETVRELLCEKLTTQESTDLGRRHAEFYAAMARAAAPHLSGLEQGRWLDDLELEADNLRAALEWASHHAPSLLPPMAQSLGRFWLVRGYYDDGRRWTGRALEHLDSQGGESAFHRQLLGGAAALAWYGGDFSTALALNEQQLKSARETNDSRSVVQALGAIAYAAAQMGDFGRSRSLFEQGLALSRELGDAVLLCEVLVNAAHEASAVGDFERARVLGDEGTQLSRNLGDARQTAFSLNITGFSSLLEGDLSRARALLEESLIVSESVGEKWHTNRVWWTLGHLARTEGDFALARERFDRALKELRDWGCLWPLPYHLEPRAYMDIAEARYERAACLLGAAQGLRESMRHPIHPVLRPEYDSHLAALRDHLDAAQLEIAWQKGRALAPDQAISLALKASS